MALTGTSGPLEHLARVARAIEWLFVRVGLAVLAIAYVRSTRPSSSSSSSSP